MSSLPQEQARYRYLPDAMRMLLIATGVLPWLLPFARSALPLGKAGEALDLVFWPMCHRFPARTLELAGVAMPLCSRCAGIFAGLALGALIARPRIRMAAWRPALFAAAALMLLEVITQDLGLHPVFHPTRIATGVLLGYAMAAAFATNVLLPAKATAQPDAHREVNESRRASS